MHICILLYIIIENIQRRRPQQIRCILPLHIRVCYDSHVEYRNIL